MHIKTTDWMTIPGGVERRAHIRADDTFNVDEAFLLYNRLTKVGMTLDQKIERGLRLHKEHGARYEHEYRRVA